MAKKNRFNNILGISDCELSDAPADEVDALVSKYMTSISESKMIITDPISLVLPTAARIRMDALEDERAEGLYRASGRYEDRIRRFDKTKKGVTLTGGVGNGKTVAMKCLSSLTGAVMLNVPEMSIAFMRGGIDQVIGLFSGTQRVDGCGPKPAVIIDDLGAEGDSKNYGQNFPIEEIIMMRYNDYCKSGTLTHFATNLSGKEISARYGDRISDRIREMTDVVVISGKSMRR